jgi:hypothetical protein
VHGGLGCYAGFVENLPPKRHVLPAMLVAAVWGFSALLVTTGNQPCSVAQVLHKPCPGCGLTRAAQLMLHGHAGDSLAMHPLLLPVVATWVLFACVTIAATLRDGVPWYFWRMRSGKMAGASAVVVYAALVVLWALRGAGFFGGPVPVS